MVPQKLTMSPFTEVPISEPNAIVEVKKKGNMLTLEYRNNTGPEKTLTG